MLVDTSQNRTVQKAQLLHRLELVRIGLHPDLEDAGTYFRIFDYSIKINGAYCDQLLVVPVKADGALTFVSWES